MTGTWPMALSIIATFAIALALGVGSAAQTTLDREFEARVTPPGLAPFEMAELGEDGIYSVCFPDWLLDHAESGWRHLRKLRVNGEIRRTLDGNGAVVVTRCDVVYCPPIDHSKDPLAATKVDWSAHAIVTYKVMLKGGNRFSLGIDGAVAENYNGVVTSAVTRKVDVWFYWVAENRRCT